MTNESRGFSPIVVILIIAVLAVGLYFLNGRNLASTISPSATPFQSSCPSPLERDSISKNTLILKEVVTKSCAGKRWSEIADIILELDNSFTILQTNKKPLIVSTKGSTFELTPNYPPGAGLCPRDESDPSCSYTDEELGKLPESGSTILRVWKNKDGVFALNPQSMFPEGYELNNIVIVKTKPTKIFTDEEIALWKSNLGNNIKAVKTAPVD